MADILSHFDIEVATEKNRSFRYFYTRFIQPVVEDEKERKDKIPISGQIPGQEISGGFD
jgi:hypothetical protein